MSKNTPHLEKAKQIMDKKLDILFSNLTEENNELLCYLLEQIGLIHRKENYCQDYTREITKSIPGITDHEEIVSSIRDLIYLLGGCYIIRDDPKKNIPINKITTLKEINEYYFKNTQNYMDQDIAHEVVSLADNFFNDKDNADT